MAIIRLSAFETATAKASGITLAKGVSKSGDYIRIGMSAEAQQHYFGHRLDPAIDMVALSIDDAAAHRHLLTMTVTNQEDSYAVAISGGIKGSISVRVALWMQAAPGKRPAERLSICHKPKTGTVVVKLPEWARPPIPKVGFGKSIMES